MQGSKKIPIIDLNQHITCKICNGYFIDATTIIECLHTFCRSCIVKYLQNNKYCPVCDVQVHKTKPLLNIRPDKTIQDIVYKLVPRLFQNETQKRRNFYENHPEGKPSSLELCGEAAYQHLLTPEETVCLTLSYHGTTATARYLRCPAAVSLGHLKKLIRAKYDLTDNHKVEILYNQDCLTESLTLMDVAYIYMWKTKGPIELTYKIYECSAKKLKLESDNGEAPQNGSSVANITINNNWKEVQLRISETGEMSITGIQDAALSPSILEIVNSDPQKYKNEVVSVVDSKSVSTKTVSKKELPGLKYIGKSLPSLTSPPKTANSDFKSGENSSVPSSCKLVAAVDVTAPSFLSNCATLSSGTTTMVFSTINSTKCSTKSDETGSKVELAKTDSKSKNEVIPTEKDDCRIELQKLSGVVNNVSDKSLKRKGESVQETEPPTKQSKPTILNHSLGLLNLSNNHPLKKHSKLNRNGENVKEIVFRSSAPAPDTASTSPSVSIPKPPTATVKTMTTTTTTDTTFSKPGPVNKNLMCPPNRPGTPITTKPSIMATKPSITPSKPPVSVYGSAGKSPCYMPKTVYNPIVNMLKSVTSTSVIKAETKLSNAGRNELKVASGPSMPKLDGKPSNAAPQTVQQQQTAGLNSKTGAKSKPNSPIGYKTLRDPPKSWNSQISKANLSKQTPDPKYSELKNVRPAKFFKMRNNMPRYLGNPASGVKPMYQVHVSPEKDKAQDTVKVEKSEIRKHSIVKIDPKTLKPISEKAPETTSLSNHSSTNQLLSNHNLASQVYQNLNNSGSNQSLPNSSMNMSGQGMGSTNQNSDLKINTSSVSIFNPLKLQSSPKNERKSPKSPHSPKLKAQATNSQTGTKRDKVNLNFTPPNPFVPNLTSPTMSPNQFLYPTGFPPYDPRMMAAYHSLWYGQRMGFPASPMPRLSLDLNQQRKNFEMMPSPTSPKMAGMNQQGHSPQISTKMTSTTTSSNASVSSKAQGLPSPAPKSNASSKKSSKESKNDKSLETTVEKLTQNRNKEISGKNETKVENATKEKPKQQSETPERHKEKEPPNMEKSDTVQNSSPLPTPVSSSSVADDCSGKVSEQTKVGEVSTASTLQDEKVGIGTECKGGASNSVRANVGKGADVASNTVKSNDLSNNVDDVKNGEGGK